MNFTLQISNARPSPFSILTFSENGPVFFASIHWGQVNIGTSITPLTVIPEIESEMPVL